MHQPFDDVLDYNAFSLRVSLSDMPSLLDILRAVPEADIQRYRENMWVGCCGWVLLVHTVELKYASGEALWVRGSFLSTSSAQARGPRCLPLVPKAGRDSI